MSELKPCPSCGHDNHVESFPVGVCCHKHKIALPRYEWQSRPIEDKLEAEIAELRKAQEWISVEDRLPKQEGRYLIRYKEGGIRKTFIGDLYLDDRLEWTWNAILNAVVTHWMEIPAPPEEVKDEQENS